MKTKAILLTGLLLFIAACTTHPKVASMTQPATVINTKDTGKVISKLAEICDRSGLQIDTTGTNNITCSHMSSAMAQAFFGTKYGTDVRTNFRFNVFPAGKGARVVAYVSMGNQTVFGQNKSADLGVGGHLGQEAQTMMDTARRELEKK